MSDLTAPAGAVTTSPSKAAPVAWFEDLSRADVPQVGGKGANLGELTRAGLPVPGGFVITADAYLDAMERGGVRAALEQQVAATDLDAPEALAGVAADLQERVHSAGVPDDLALAVLEAYARLGGEPRSRSARRRPPRTRPRRRSRA